MYYFYMLQDVARIYISIKNKKRNIKKDRENLRQAATGQVWGKTELVWGKTGRVWGIDTLRMPCEEPDGVRGT